MRRGERAACASHQRSLLLAMVRHDAAGKGRYILKTWEAQTTYSDRPHSHGSVGARSRVDSTVVGENLQQRILILADLAGGLDSRRDVVEPFGLRRPVVDGPKPSPLMIVPRRVAVVQTVRQRKRRRCWPADQLLIFSIFLIHSLISPFLD